MNYESRQVVGTKGDDLHLEETSPPVFILSTGRSGSTMLARALGRHPALYCLHEPQPKLNAESLAIWNGSHPESEVRSKVALKRDWLVSQTHQQRLVYVESAYFLAHLVPILDDLYGAKFIHLYRDGRDFVRSGYDRPWYVERRHPATVVKRWIRRRFLVDIGVSNEDHQLPSPNELDDRFGKIAWLWAEINRVIARDLDRLPDDRSLAIAVEKLNDPSGFRRVLKFFGEADEELVDEMVGLARQKPNKVDDHRLPPSDEWSESRVATFDRVAGDMMQRLGYTDAPSR